MTVEMTMRDFINRQCKKYYVLNDHRLVSVITSDNRTIVDNESIIELSTHINHNLNISDIVYMPHFIDVYLKD